MTGQYTDNFFESRKTQTQRSAESIIECLFSNFKPRSVLDLGCGTGTWLAECTRQGVEKISGVDGPWVKESLLEINSENFKNINLEEQLYVPTEKYDLAISIEVAEHLSQLSGQNLVDSLTSSSDVILFSAAVPGQGGTGHINEQLQSYWAEKFKKRDFVCVDLVRPIIWENGDVNVIYKQNMCVYIQERVCNELGLSNYLISDEYQINRIHPDLFKLRSDRNKSHVVKDNIRKIKRKFKNWH